MGYVNEARSAPQLPVTSKFNASTFTRTLRFGRSESQYGYRSGALAPQQKAAISGSVNWATSQSAISQIEDENYEYLGHESVPTMVHDRDYTRVTYNPATFVAVGKEYAYGVYQRSFDSKGHFGFDSLNAGTLFPQPVSMSAGLSIAAGLMRRSVPNTHSFDLYRSIAEQRDAPRLAKALSLKGLTPAAFQKAMRTDGLTGVLSHSKAIPKKAANLYLSYVFGVKPTYSDIQATADSIIGINRGVRNYMGDAAVDVRTSRSVELYKKSLFSETLLSSPAGAPGQYLVFQGTAVVGDYLIPTTWSKTCVRWSLSANTTLKQFATWEYFIPSPTELGSRLDGYDARASAIIGEGASLGTIYDLTPWSWMVDWFADIGGLLHYQQQLADNQIVARANGYSIIDAADVTCSVSSQIPVTYNPNLEIRQGFYVQASAGLSYFRHRRAGGNPYSILPDWSSLSGQQLAILAALGISKGT